MMKIISSNFIAAKQRDSMIILNQNFPNRRITIRPYDTSVDEFIVYDLRVGRTYQEPGDANTYEMPKAYTIKPGRCILVTTEETLNVPENVFGQICSKGSLTSLGLFVGNTKIDPLFVGQLKISVFNASDRPIEIKPKQKFCSIFFQTIEHTVPVNTIRHAPGMSIQKRNSIKDFFHVYKAEIITAIITIILSGVTAYAATYAALSSGR